MIVTNVKNGATLDWHGPGPAMLLVEDDPNDVELTLRALRGRGLALEHVAVARDGEQALSLLSVGSAQGWTPRLVLLDLHLPKVSGLQVLGQVRAASRTRTLPVVVLTSSAETPDVQSAYRLGANSYLVKPVAYEAFSERVAALGLYWLLHNEPPLTDLTDV